jgi:hypothetical protein
VVPDPLDALDASPEPPEPPEPLDPLEPLEPAVEPVAPGVLASPPHAESAKAAKIEPSQPTAGDVAPMDLETMFETRMQSSSRRRRWPWAALAARRSPLATPRSQCAPSAARASNTV